MTTAKIKLYTDGACSQNPGPGGWAFVMILKDLYGTQDEKELLRGSGGEKMTTNNRMESKPLPRIKKKSCLSMQAIRLPYIPIRNMCSKVFHHG